MHTPHDQPESAALPSGQPALPKPVASSGDDVAARLDALLDQIESASDQLASAVGTPEQTTGDSIKSVNAVTAEPSTEVAAHEIDKLLSEAVGSLGTDPAPVHAPEIKHASASATSEPNAGAAAVNPDASYLGSQIDQLLATADSSSTATQGNVENASSSEASTPRTNAAEKQVEAAAHSLDDEIAKLADTLLKDGLPRTNPNVQSAAAHVPAPTVDTPRQMAEIPVVAPVVTAPQPAQPVSAQTEAPRAPAAAVASEPAAASSVESGIERTVSAPVSNRASVASTLNRAGLAAATLISMPLAGRSKVVRDSIGWFAMNTLFLAACLWGYLVFVRQPALNQMPAPASFDFHDGHVPTPPPEGEHAKAPADAHGAEKKDDPGAAAESHDEKPGGAVKPKAAKKIVTPVIKKPGSGEAAKEEPAKGGGH